ncbi:phosphatidylserine decarboxylase [Candidatus Nitrosoglobus terrae]|uniref:Phosphatidylserine decarboxylase n=1 Tax=Candidatus Nitrosoglobus terrae TaxID=1630141 RepID=A0A1Q2SL70_9GAMM|nr:phosphatidylserine decarboxylase [Candidatus Nitrosoglobus terrae]BAW79853.1 phosphatidylserine decarboxylase [Candidatus Nitrosoglobus terrae]
METHKSYGRLRWNPVSAREAQHLDKQGASSPALQESKFLQNLPLPSTVYDPKQPITKKLKDLINNYAYGGAFQSTISTVCQQRIPELDRIHNLYQFYYYIDTLATWMPGLRVWEWQDNIYHERTDYLRLTQFYYYFNQPELVALQSPVDPATGANLTPLSLWLREFAVEWGQFLDTPESAKYLESYKFGPEYAYQDYNGGENGIKNYKTFNEWFSRTFKDIDRQRPVAQPDDPRIIAFPAESTFVGQWAITTPAGEPMPAESSIVVKHIEWPIPELLKDSAYARDFEGGIFVHSFLNVYDYHRQHAPASGKILEAKFIPGQVYLDVKLEVLDTAEERANVNSNLASVVNPCRYLDAQDATGYQFVQCRGLFVLETAIGKIAILPIGMAQVSSVVFVKPGTQELIRLTEEERKGKSYDEQVALINQKARKEVVGKTVSKGEMISAFLFGGSDIVMVFQRQSNVNITTTTGVHYPVRSQYAYSNIAQLLKF